jgi:alpha-galactosidase
MEKEYISSATLIDLKNILDEMVYQNRLSESEMEKILKKAGLKKSGKVWVDELGSEYSNM